MLGWPTRPLLARTLSELIGQRLAGMPMLVPEETAARQIADAQLALVESWVSGRPACGIDAMEAALVASSGALVAALADAPLRRLP